MAHVCGGLSPVSDVRESASPVCLSRVSDLFWFEPMDMWMSTLHMQPERQQLDPGPIDAHLRAIVDSGFVSLVTLDPGTLGVIDVNDSLCQIVGRRALDVPGLPFADLVHPDDWRRNLQGFHDLAAGATVRMTGEIRLMSPGGVPVWFAHSSSVAHDGADAPAHIVVVLHDISSRKASEAALLQNEERYYPLLESIDQGFCAIEILHDAAGNPNDYLFLEVNPAFERHTGLKDPVGKTARELVPGLEQDWIKIYGRVADTGEAQQFELGSEAMGRWFKVDAVRIGSDGSNRVAVLFIDITERRRSEAHLRASEEALRESRRRFELAQQAASVGIWDWNLRDGFATIAGDYHNLMGLSPEIDVVDLDTWLSCIHPDDRDRAAHDVQSVLDGASPYFTDIRALHPDGRIVYLQNRGEVLLDAEGKPERMVGALVDITARKRAEDALRESERQLQLLANAMPQVVWVADRNGVVRYFNDRIGAFAGASRSESGEWVWDRSHYPDDVVTAQIAWRASVANGTPYSNEHRIMMADGNYRWHLSRAFPVLSDRGDIERWYGTSTDVHDLKMVEHELERRRREFETLIEHSPDFVARFDRDLRHLYINSVVETVTGMPASDFIGRTIAELGMPEDVITIWDHHCREVIATGAPQHFEFAFDGVLGRQHFRTRLLPEYAPDGTVETLISVSYDITDRVLAEQDRQSLLDALAHDLKSPLATLKLLAQMMKRQAARGNVPDADGIAERGASFEGLAVRMTDMVDELTDQARLASGLPAELGLGSTNLVALVRQCVEEIEPTAPNHRIVIDTATDPLDGEWDTRRLRRVFENIIGNAIKYSPEGGQIEIRLDVTGDEAIAEVHDHGIGIPTTSLDRIFEFRARGENVGSISGSGIGLAGARWIIELHGGTISVQSTEGLGSTFTIRLPLRSSNPGHIAGAPPTATVPQNRKHSLT